MILGQWEVERETGRERLGGRDWERERERETGRERLGERDWERESGRERLGERDWKRESGKRGVARLCEYVCVRRVCGFRGGKGGRLSEICNA